jgi:chromosome partitioning protein
MTDAAVLVAPPSTVPEVAGPSFVTITNEKGGVGKTAMVCNIATILAVEFNLRVLVLDLDSQGNSSKAMNGPDIEWAKKYQHHRGVLPADAKGPRNIIDFLDGQVPPSDVLVPSPHCKEGRLWFIHGSGLLNQWTERRFRSDPSRSQIQVLGDIRNRLRAQLAALRMGGLPFDLVVADVPPTTGEALRFALAATDGVVIVTDPTSDSVEGAGKIVGYAKVLGERLAAPITLRGIILNRVSQRKSIESDRIDDIRRNWPTLILEPPVPDNISVRAGTEYRIPVVIAEPKASTSVAIRQIARSLALRSGLTLPAIDSGDK